ncbi:Replication origin-binding protein [Frankliniella fusca]|uniref:Replication origin-binding protein n=1 Tax=Frankliniella fusca TaxID=407009 RepID=A0AAE1H6T7_9NEOP|nr:Replication origin-binding protein [Frankliniella fusca]
MASKTRTQTDKWLVGQPLASPIACSKLPTTGQMLRRFFFIQSECSDRTLRECAMLTLQEAYPFWQRCGVPLQEMKHAIDTFLLLHTEWTKLKKDKSRTGDRYEQVRGEFKARLEQTYDLARVDAEEIMCEKIEKCRNEKERAAMKEDLEFYKLQMKCRVGSMLQKDMLVVKKEKQQRKILEKKEELKRKLEADNACTSETYKKVLWDSVKVEELSECEDNGEEESHADKDFSEEEHRKRKIKCDVLSPSLLASLDRNNITDRRATRVIKETAQALGHDVETLNLSRRTVGRKREENRIAAIENFSDIYTPEGPVVVHWDGKILPNEQGKKIDRLPVLVKDLGSGNEQLLGVAALEDGSGKSQQTAIKDLAVARKVDSNIVGMSFDTTSTNTGPFIGACVLLEEALGRTLIRLPCRHHVLELPIKGGFDSLSAASTSPVTALYERFAKFWPTADPGNYVTAVQLQVIRRIANADEIIMFCNQQLSMEKMPRDDYKHLLMYTVTFLGGVPPGGVRFYKPGTVNKTRFMGNALYCLIITMFSRQFEMSPAEKAAALETSLFTVMAYVKPWILANVAATAPRMDLELLKILAHEITRHKKNDARKTLWHAAGYKFLGHLWYLSPELVCLALFDEDVSVTEKKKIVESINSNPVDDECTYKGFVGKLDSSVKDLQLSDFANHGSLHFFEKLNVDPDFLSIDPSEWEGNESYLKVKRYVKNLPTTNDAAERGVAIAKQFNNVLTTKEEQKQGLYVTVANDRKLVKQVKK